MANRRAMSRPDDCSEMPTSRNRPTSRNEAQIAMIVVAFLTIISVLHSSIDIKMTTAGLLDEKVSTTQQQTHITMPGQQEKGASCLSLGFKKDMDHLLSKYKQVWIIMPAKAAGTSFKEFTKDCMAAAGTPSFANQDNPFINSNRSETAFLGQLEMPSLVASHLYQFETKPFCNVMKHASKDTLVVYSYREDTSRLISSIKEVVAVRLCEQKAQGFTVVDDECRVEEAALIKAIKEKKNEIGIGNTQLLTCESYDCIVDNNPNVVFMHYKQASQLQKLVAKHHCPSVEQSVKNVGSDKRAVSVVLQGQSVNGQVKVVSLDNWLSAKKSMLEMALCLKQTVSCQATTRDIEHELFACPSEALQVSGRSYDDEKIQFPFSNR